MCKGSCSQFTDVIMTHLGQAFSLWIYRSHGIMADCSEIRWHAPNVWFTQCLHNPNVCRQLFIANSAGDDNDIADRSNRFFNRARCGIELDRFIKSATPDSTETDWKYIAFIFA